MTTRSTVSRLALGAALLAGAAGSAQAQDSGPLIDALVRKGILTDQEGEELRTELLRDFGATSPGKLDVSSSVTRLKISGDIRLRQQFDVQTPTSNTQVDNERSRTRFRFRLNGDFTLQKGWSAGFALESASAADSGNQTFQDGNDDYSIHLARAYVGYETGNFTFLGGKWKNPFYTTDLVWDSDINPQGLSEAYLWQIDDSTSVNFVAGQILMDDNLESSSSTTTSDDAWMFYQQAEFSKSFGKLKANKFVIAPGFFFYNASTVAGLGNESAFTGSTENFRVFLLPGEFSFKNVGREGYNAKLYWDFAYNTAAEDRVREAYNRPATVDEDPLAWLVGLSYGYGSGRLAGDWKFSVDYREIGLGSIDPNINDSDFAFSHLNQKGFKFGASYNLADFAALNATYFLTEELNDTPAGPALGIADLDSSSILQLDLNVKF